MVAALGRVRPSTRLLIMQAEMENVILTISILRNIFAALTKRKKMISVSL